MVLFGGSLNFILPKFQAIQPSRTQNLLSFHGVNVTKRLPPKILCLHDLYEITLFGHILIDLKEGKTT
jgi:hypothetical protein